jgi:hypothetical protein
MFFSLSVARCPTCHRNLPKAARRCPWCNGRGMISHDGRHDPKLLADRRIATHETAGI